MGNNTFLIHTTQKTKTIYYATSIQISSYDSNQIVLTII